MEMEKCILKMVNIMKEDGYLEENKELVFINGKMELNIEDNFLIN